MGQIEEVGRYLSRKPIPLSHDAEARVGGRLWLSNNGTSNAVYKAPPVDYVYDRTRVEQREIWPGPACSSSARMTATAFPRVLPGSWWSSPRRLKGRSTSFSPI